MANRVDLEISTHQQGNSGVRTNRVMMVGAILGSVSSCWTYNLCTIDDDLTFCSAFSKLSAIAGNEQLKQVPVQRIRRDRRSRFKADNRWIRLAGRGEEEEVYGSSGDRAGRDKVSGDVVLAAAAADDRYEQEV